MGWFRALGTTLSLQVRLLQLWKRDAAICGVMRHLVKDGGRGVSSGRYIFRTLVRLSVIWKNIRTGDEGWPYLMYTYSTRSVN